MKDNAVAKHCSFFVWNCSIIYVYCLDFTILLLPPYIWECGNCFIKRTFQSHCVSARVYCKNSYALKSFPLSHAELFFVQWNLCYIDQEFFINRKRYWNNGKLIAVIYNITAKPKLVFIKAWKIFCVWYSVLPLYSY